MLLFVFNGLIRMIPPRIDEPIFAETGDSTLDRAGFEAVVGLLPVSRYGIG